MQVSSLQTGSISSSGKKQPSVSTSSSILSTLSMSEGEVLSQLFR